MFNSGAWASRSARDYEIAYREGPINSILYSAFILLP